MKPEESNGLVMEEWRRSAVHEKDNHTLSKRVSERHGIMKPMQWDELELAPIILIKSAEPVIAERAVDRLKELARQQDPQTDVSTLESAGYSRGTLEQLTTPSLFGEPRFIIIPDLEKLNADFQDDLLRYLSTPEYDAVIVLIHNGGVRGKKVLDALARIGVQTASIAQIKSARDKTAAVMADVRRAGRKMTSDAIGALIDAIGSDVRELLAAVNQLMADVDGTIESDHVRTYFAGRIEATGYNVADALIAGRTGKAIELARHAVATGASPVAIVASIASKLRIMAQVLGQRSNAFDVKISMAPWQIDNAKRDLRGWTAEGLGRAIVAIAKADASVKGESRDAHYALERGILEIGRARKIK